jgi:hypothetical protein
LRPPGSEPRWRARRRQSSTARWRCIFGGSGRRGRQAALADAGERLRPCFCGADCEAASPKWQAAGGRMLNRGRGQYPSVARAELFKSLSRAFQELCKSFSIARKEPFKSFRRACGWLDPAWFTAGRPLCRRETAVCRCLIGRASPALVFSAACREKDYMKIRTLPDRQPARRSCIESHGRIREVSTPSSGTRGYSGANSVGEQH